MMMLSEEQLNNLNKETLVIIADSLQDQLDAIREQLNTTSAQLSDTNRQIELLTEQIRIMNQAASLKAVLLMGNFLFLIQLTNSKLQ